MKIGKIINNKIPMDRLKCIKLFNGLINNHYKWSTNHIITGNKSVLHLNWAPQKFPNCNSLPKSGS